MAMLNVSQGHDDKAKGKCEAKGSWHLLLPLL